jgi:hypothetical protein
VNHVASGHDEDLFDSKRTRYRRVTITRRFQGD